MTETLFVSATTEEAVYLPDGIDLLVTGIGTTAATMILTKELATREVLPARIVNIGTAGALVDGLAGVYEIEYVLQHDFSSELIAEMTGKPCSNGSTLATSGHFPVASLATGNSFIADSETRNHLATRASSAIWRAALVGVAKHFGVPITLLKQVSDSADEEASGSWFDAVDAGARQLAEAVKEFK